MSSVRDNLIVQWCLFCAPGGARVFLLLLLTQLFLGGRLSADKPAIGLAELPPPANKTEEAKDGQHQGDWWSLRPVMRPRLPKLSGNDAAWVRTPVDAFVMAKLREKGLAPSPEADRRTLIRRLYFDLIGLPPAPEDIEQFVRDSDPDGYEKLVDCLLGSPRYGERWARHWLDVVHYGDTHGYDKDKPRANAWPYRDYVIRSLNQDKSYRRFVREQLAGDVLFPDTVDGIEATGFIAAGPWDFIGHAELPETKIDGKVARHLDRDDMVSTVMNTFVSLTVQCAQCHNHKFDPISQEDYYSLQAVFAALDRADRIYDKDPILAKKRNALEAQRRPLLEQKQALETKVKELGGAELAELDKKIQTLSKPSGERPEFGYHSQIEPAAAVVKWVQVDLGHPVAIDRLVFVGCFDNFNNIGAGFGFPARFKIEISHDEEFKTGVTVVADHTQADYTNPQTAPQTLHLFGKRARFVRMTATKLAYRQNDYIFALGELSVYDQSEENVALGATVTALDSIEAPPRWQKSNLVDGYYYGVKPQVDDAGLVDLKQKRQSLMDRLVDPQLQRELAEVSKSIAELESEINKLPKPSVVFAGTVHYGSGNFRGTGPDGGKPRVIQLLNRGDVRQPGEIVGPGALSAIKVLGARFELAENHSEGQRRMALADWITAERNPLTWRSIVNRIWLYHFGRGLVDSPNDFGRMGQLPSHPELLDWLAAEFRDGGQSLKRLHRLMVNSATYRQSSAGNERSSKVDADNIYHWRMNRRRLEAEAIHDSVLWVSGKLDLRMFGPGFQDFVIEKPEHSPHYEYHLHDPEDPRSNRRSIYRFIVRSQPQPFMTTLDCADPSMLVDKRNQTLTPLQALALLNNKLMVAMCQHFAERVHQADRDLSSKLDQAFELAIGRKATDQERMALIDYAQRHGLANSCRLIFNLNEFVFVD